VNLGRTTPILRIFDEAKAREFYVGFLGFGVDWQHRFGDDFPLYLQVSRDGCVLHLSEHHGDCTPGAAVRIQTTGIEDLHGELDARGYRFAKPQLERADWGERFLSVRDPFGNRLTFFEQPVPTPAER
jgi:catechol 2,3-dioxygenase-like lactoylglutathione lyase family enzyme